MRYTKHSLDRMNTRGITHCVARLAFDYGVLKGDKVILTKKVALQRMCEARAEAAALSKTLDHGVANLSDHLHQLKALEDEIRYLKKLIDKQGVTLVVVDDLVITAYGIR
jgi:phage I-like protein